VTRDTPSYWSLDLP